MANRTELNTLINQYFRTVHRERCAPHAECEADETFQTLASSPTSMNLVSSGCSVPEKPRGH